MILAFLITEFLIGMAISMAVSGALMLVSALLQPKPKSEDIKPSGLGDFTFPTAAEDRVIPIIFGTVLIGGPNVVWYGDLNQEAITKKMKTGLFSSTKKTVGYRYYVGIQFALCRGPVDDMRSVQVGEKIVDDAITTHGSVISIDRPNFFGGEETGQGGLIGDLRFYAGTATQTVNSYLHGFQLIEGDTPAYRGTCYCVWEQGYVGTSDSMQPWAFEVRRIPNGLGAATPAINSDLDANPACVLYEILTNTEWGLGFADADIDLVSLRAAAVTLASESNGISLQIDSVRTVSDVIQLVLEQIEGVLYLDRVTGKWKLVLARDGYTVGDLPALNSTNVIAMTDFARGSWSDTMNVLTLRYTRRAQHKYKETVITLHELANIQLQGTTIPTSISYPGVHTATSANRLAARELRTLSRPLAKVNLTVDRTFWDVAPGDLLRWTDASMGFTDLVLRVCAVDLGELADGQIKLSLIEDVFADMAPASEDPEDSGWVDPTPPDAPADPDVDPVVVIADIPRFKETQELVAGVYIGITVETVPASSVGGSEAYDPTFRGATIFISYDGGTSYTAALNQYGRPMRFPDTSFSPPAPDNSNIGRAVTALDDGTDRTTWDTTGDVVVVMGNQSTELADSTDALVTDTFANIAYCGSEVMGFVNVTLETAVTGDEGPRYTLGRLARGIQNTPMTGHIVNELFMVLDSSVQFLPIDQRYIGETLYIKAVPDGQTAASVTGHSFEYLARNVAKQPVTGVGVVRTEFNSGNELAADAMVTWEDPDALLHAVFEISAPGQSRALYSVVFSDAQVDITNAVVGTGTITFTAGRKCPGVVGGEITVEGVSPSGYNDVYTIDSFSADYKSFTVTTANSPASYSAGGTATTYADFPRRYNVMSDLFLYVSVGDQILNPLGSSPFYDLTVRSFNADRYTVKIRAVGMSGMADADVAEFTAPDI